MTRTVTGFESIAQAVADSGVKVVASYPGGPITKVVESLIALAKSRDMHVEWSNCEKVAFEVAAGCCTTGVRAAMIAKHVGINHILDPLMTFNLTGVGGGLVILAGDEPGAYGSQNEQDSRLLGAFAEIPILEPADPAEGYAMTRQAFALSETFEIPVMVRFVGDYTEETGPFSTTPPCGQATAQFNDRNRWKSLPANVVRDHAALHGKLAHLGRTFCQQPYSDFNQASGKGRSGLIAAGHVAARLKAFPEIENLSVLKLGTIHPLPEELIVSFLRRTDRVWVLEEVEPFIENQVRIIAQKNRIATDIRGKTTGHVAWEGDLDSGKITRLLKDELALDIRPEPPRAKRYPSRQALGQGCPYKPFFSALKRITEADKGQAPIVVGETGCLVRLNNPPLEMLDVKYALGSSAAMASGLSHSGVKNKIVAAMGDSVFFHTGINGVINAAHNDADIIIAVMDNATVALTGFQAPVGGGVTAMGKQVEPILPEKVAEALNIGYIRTLDAFDEAAIECVLRECLGRKGLAFLVVRGRCPYIETKKCQAA